MKKIFVLVAIGFLCLSMLVLRANASNSLAGYWKFDEGSGTIAHDFSGNGNDGTIHDATWTTGIVGGALQFDGVDSWVDVPSSPTLSGFSQMTIEAWIKIDSFQSQVKGIVCKASGTAMPTPDAEYALILLNNTPYFEVDNGNFVFVDYAYHATPDANTWYHVAGTWNGTYYAIYVDGFLCNSGTNAPISPYSYPIDLQIGRLGTYSWTYFNGTIDEVKIYNYARTAAEIESDFQSVSVGGQWTPITLQTLSQMNSLQLIAPWIAVAAVAAIATSFIAFRPKKKPTA